MEEVHSVCYKYNSLVVVGVLYICNYNLYVHVKKCYATIEENANEMFWGMKQ